LKVVFTTSDAGMLSTDLARENWKHTFHTTFDTFHTSDLARENWKEWMLVSPHIRKIFLISQERIERNCRSSSIFISAALPDLARENWKHTPPSPHPFPPLSYPDLARENWKEREIPRYEGEAEHGSWSRKRELKEVHAQTAMDSPPSWSRKRELKDITRVKLDVTELVNWSRKRELKELGWCLRLPWL